MNLNLLNICHPLEAEHPKAAHQTLVTPKEKVRKLVFMCGFYVNYMKQLKTTLFKYVRIHATVVKTKIIPCLNVTNTQKTLQLQFNVQFGQIYNVLTPLNSNGMS